MNDQNKPVEKESLAYCATPSTNSSNSGTGIHHITSDLTTKSKATTVSDSDKNDDISSEGSGIKAESRGSNADLVVDPLRSGVLERQPHDDRFWVGRLSMGLNKVYIIEDKPSAKRQATESERDRRKLLRRRALRQSSASRETLPGTSEERYMPRDSLSVDAVERPAEKIESEPVKPADKSRPLVSRLSSQIKRLSEKVSLPKLADKAGRRRRQK